MTTDIRKKNTDIPYTTINIFIDEVMAFVREVEKSFTSLFCGILILLVFSL